MTDLENYEEFKDGFFEYREFHRFKALSNENGLQRFSALCLLIDRAEQQLSICYARDVIDFSNQIKEILQEHYEALYLGLRKSSYAPTRMMDDGPSELCSLKDVFDEQKTKLDGKLDDLLMWGLWFAVFALMKVAEAVEAVDEKMAADAAIDAMDAIGLAELIDFQWKAVRNVEALEQTKKELRKKAMDALRLREIEAESRRQLLSMAGKTGAQSLHRRATELKAWALGKAAGMRGRPTDIARKLSGQIPNHLADASTKPERMIYDALRASSKKKN